MADKGVKLREDQAIRRYVGIDVTGVVDTVAFGNMWTAKFRWRNLLLDLKADPADATRRTDTAHPKLPIKRVGRTHAGTTYADTCIMPENVDGSGANYAFTDLMASDVFMQTFILRPSVDAASSSLNDKGTGAVADIVYISSHGLHEGEMYGPAGLWPVSAIFKLNKTARNGGQFSGPGWVVLSNCGTLDDATHGNWLKLMAGPTPLRGIVGFRDTCPAEGDSVEFVSLFIEGLANGETLLNAWKDAVATKVGSKAWRVLCHEEAEGDTISTWNASSLKNIGPGSKIMRFDDSAPGGVPLVPVADPFEAFWSKAGTRITADNRDGAANHINGPQAGKPGDDVTITVRPEAPATTFIAGKKIAVTVVYIRPDYGQRVDVNAMFKLVGQTGASPPTITSKNLGQDTWDLTVVGSPAEIVLTLQCVDFSSLHEAGKPLRLQVDNGSTNYLFVLNGSVIQR
jgi:hypothetical protein